MQGFVFISFHPFGGGVYCLILINDMILKCELCFLFPFQNEYECGYMLKSIVFGSFYHPFQDGYKNFHKTDIVSVASPGQDTSYLNCLLQSFLYVGILLSCFLTDTQISNS